MWDTSVKLDEVGSLRDGDIGPGTPFVDPKDGRELGKRTDVDIQGTESQLPHQSRTACCIDGLRIPGGKQQIVCKSTGAAVCREEGAHIKLQYSREVRKAGATIEARQSQVDEQVLCPRFTDTVPQP